LTFAAYDYLKNSRGLNIKMTGIDANSRLIDLCNQISATCGFSGLDFRTGMIADTRSSDTDVLVALHACDTATDDAIFRGISQKAKIILVSPCCHKEIRPQLKPPAYFRDTLKHGTLLERQAELITDGLRSLLLERHGYRTKVFEFVPTQHTPKNNMIAAVLSDKPNDSLVYETQMKSLKNVFGIESFHLENLLSGHQV
ncbi:MAG: SAM-dependent methyltransferase, partial [Acidobacteriota bacterium]|nr:SAM-dependent methyltransferase [Acidobacteriota bacterium]